MAARAVAPDDEVALREGDRRGFGAPALGGLRVGAVAALEGDSDGVGVPADGTDGVSGGPACGAGQTPAIELRGATFTYPGSVRPAVADLDFNIAPGERIALLGRSGAGKSTLLGLIRGDLSPQAGAVELFGSAHPGADAACGTIGVISQDPHVFNTTVLDNLRIARPSATEREAWDVLERVGLRERVERFPDGVLSVVGEEGRLLSGGERHRLALARILLADTPVVVLDEPFVGLDPSTERSVLDAVLAALEGRTLLMVTHHLQGVDRMDRAAFLEDGRFVLMGDPAELARTSHRYQRLLALDRGFAG
ncbi:MAG: ATP-binding cassette domain-containing protein [Coriobacteriaceae bacterium]|nr:ATP-binding cassette domain-containing protein [Coriobacteriaceae bacterium]